MSDVICHLLTQLPTIRRSLRRYAGERKCPGPMGYCDAQAFLDEIPAPVQEVIGTYDFPRSDSRWPLVCPHCNKPFEATDTWQVFVDHLYQRDTGEVIALRDAQPGDLWDAWWMPDSYKNKQDNLCLVLKLPNNHDWMIDGGSQQNPAPGAWTRTGTPPKISASPSILAADYHGWLKDGVLSSV